MSTHNFFITRSPSPPTRWKEAFPKALILNDPTQLAKPLPDGTILWLHNPAPGVIASLAGRAPLVALADLPSEEAGLSALGERANGFANAYATPELLRSIAAVVSAGGLWVGEALLNRLTKTLAIGFNPFPIEQSSLLAKLTARERDVALRVVQGASNKEIAASLDIAERTVKAHLSAVFEKLGARDRLHLALLLKVAPPIA